MSSLKKFITTTPHDKTHFPATNQAHYCWQRYNEFVLCLKKNSGDDEACIKQRQLAHSICPDEWVTQWDEQRTAGNFLGVQVTEPAADSHGHH